MIDNDDVRAVHRQIEIKSWDPQTLRRPPVASFHVMVNARPNI